MAEQLSKTYEPKEIEKLSGKLWLDGKYFHAEPPSKGGRDAKPYTIVIPPPNVTGALHMGHALNNTLQDILIRLKRMQGFNTLWMPGTDHAGIATQSVVERKVLTETGQTRHQVGREKLVAMIWQWKNQYGNRILDQLAAIGASCDWDRTRFTLDEVCAKAVRATFVNLFKKGLIYRGKRLVNWDPVLQTAVADDEVEHKTVQGNFYYIKYPLVKTGSTAEGGCATQGLASQDTGKMPVPQYITVATTRPETMLGDTAVAVNPKDERAAGFIGQKVKLPLTNREIPVIGDDYVKRGEGTGFLKVTPAHDPNDYEIGLRHDLPMINIFTPDAKVNENGGEFAGMDRFAARKAVVAKLQEMGLIEKIEPREHEVGHSYRSGVPIEPYLSYQWFVKVTPLARRAIDAVEKGEVKFHPQRYERTYLDWLYGVRDWCISRQLWWGHRIPVWHMTHQLENETDIGRLATILQQISIWKKQGRLVAATRNKFGTEQTGIEYDENAPLSFIALLDPENDDEDIVKFLEANGFVQDPDVLDTWFSSALWPHSTLGWPDGTEELKFYYPTNTLVTSRDIITLWVSRMVMMGLENCDKVPFTDVFIHGKILDGEGQTMSKSKGNGIDPVDIINSYGADAMRFSLAMMTTESQDMRMPVIKDEHGRNISDKFDIGRNFCNKLWNASRFAMMNLEGMDPAKFDADMMTIEDRWILSRLADTIADVTELLENFKYSEPLSAIYRFFWNDLCDWYLEWIKPRMRDPEAKQIPQNVLAVALDQTLRLLHPFVPFITEGIFQKLNELVPVRRLAGLVEPEPAKALVIAQWPKRIDETLENPDVEAQIATVQAVIRAIREIRNQYNVQPGKELETSANAPDAIATMLNDNADLVCHLAGLSNFYAGAEVEKPKNAAAAIVDEMQVYVHDVIDPEAERKRLEKQKEQILGFMKPIEAKLANENFVSRAKPEVVLASRDKLKELQDQLATVEKHLAEI